MSSANADLLSVARDRAQEFGVADRVSFVEGDAAKYADDEPFDVAFWSQHFFPRGTRKAALANALARLRSGGLLLLPRDARGWQTMETGSPGAQQVSINAIFAQQWDTPVLARDELAKEPTEAGFVDAYAPRGQRR